MFFQAWVGCLAGTISLLPFAPQALDEAAHAPAGAIADVVYLGLFPTAVVFTLWAYSPAHNGGGRMASATLTVPAVAVLLSLATVSEVPTTLAVVGGAICLTGIAFSHRQPLT